MGHHVLQSHALVRFDEQDFIDEVFCLVADSLPVYFIGLQLDISDVVVGFSLSQASERCSAG